MTTESVQGKAPNGASDMRQEFGAHEIAVRTETATTAMAAQAKANVEARFILALQRPRDIDTVRVKLLKECKRPGFAQVARYSKPVGGQRIEGASIRFAEAALRLMGNVLPETSVIYDDNQKRIVRVSVTDLETNLTYSSDVSVEKTVERSFIKDGQVPLSTRKNSNGKPVYLMPATEDDIANKVNANVSKALRGHALRILPGDILEEAMEQCLKTLNSEAAADPDRERKKIADAFASLRVMPNHLAEYLGHAIDTCAPSELVELRALYQAIKDGETTWHAAVEQKSGGKKPVSKTKERVAAATGAKPVVDTTADQAPTHDPTMGEVAPEDEPRERQPGEEG
jgi:hypothetical protein